MDKERWNIRDSVDDAIKILDSAPVHNDLSPEYMLVRITNRAPIAHLAIERGLKFLWYQTGGHECHTHDLPLLYKRVKANDPASAAYLSCAYDETISFFRYNIESRDLAHLQSLESYLDVTGTKQVFQKIRYWVLDSKPIPGLQLLLHREILYALSRLLLNDMKETVVTRVERRMTDALFNDRSLSYISGDTESEENVHRYRRWLHTHTSARHVLKESVEVDFAVQGADEFAMQQVKEAYEELQKSEDIAVRYYLMTLNYLPKGSQPRFEGTQPILRFNANETYAAIETPAAYPIGHIAQQHDGSWLTTCYSGENVIAESYVDAVNYMVNISTRRMLIIVSGEQRVLRLVSDSKYFHSSDHTMFTASDSDVIDLDAVASYTLELWDSEHGLEVGDEVQAMLQSDTEWASNLKGCVVEVKRNEVTVRGSSCLGPKSIIERLAL